MHGCGGEAFRVYRTCLQDILAEGADDAEYKEGVHTEESERCYVCAGGTDDGLNVFPCPRRARKTTWESEGKSCDGDWRRGKTPGLHELGGNKIRWYQTKEHIVSGFICFLCA